MVVTEFEVHRVTVLSSTGELVRSFGSCGRGVGEFSYPWGVAVSADNHIFVADAYKLQWFTFTGHFEASISLMGYGLAMHQNGKVYSINGKAQSIHVFHPDLSPSYSFGSNDLTRPCDVAIDTRGMVYVTDSSKREVLKFTSEGQYLTSIGRRPDQFACPLGICIDSNDIIYVTDTDKHQIMMFTTEGEFLGSFGGTGQRVLQPRGVAVDKTGNLYVCDASGEVLVSRIS